MDQKESEVAAQEEIVEKPKNEKRPEKVSPEVERMCQEVEGIEKIDEKIRHVLAFMRTALTGQKEAQLGLFWKGRSKCMELFKEPMLQATRSVLWTEYLELIQEARRVKEILDEAASFAVEQIEIAIKALEESLQQLPELLKQGKDVELPPFVDKGCLSHWGEYRAIQKELVQLNAFAARVQTLRKEVIQTGMRLKVKNRFFVRLSACGDHIFPRRRELIKTLSEAFQEDVDRFVDVYFKSKSKEAQNYVLREEIKHYQELAKVLTLNTAVFSRTRKDLSWAWDSLKERDKERKIELAQKREVFKKNVDVVMEKIAPLVEKCAQEGADPGEIQKEVDEILAFMRTVELAREDVHRLKEELKRAQSPIFEKEKALAEERRREREERENKRKEEAAAFLQELEQCERDAIVLDFDAFKERLDLLKQKQADASLNQAETRTAQMAFESFETVLGQKFEESVFAKEGEPEYLEELKALLELKVGERQECKKRLEAQRKAIGGSGLDFQQALDLRGRFEAEKHRLEELDASIERIEDHIDKLT